MFLCSKESSPGGGGGGGSKDFSTPRRYLGTELEIMPGYPSPVSSSAAWAASLSLARH